MILVQRNRIWIFCISPSAETYKYRIGDTRDIEQLIISVCSFTENSKLHPLHTGFSLVPFHLNCFLASRSGYQIFSQNFSVWKFKPFQSQSEFCFDDNWLTLVLTPTQASKKDTLHLQKPSSEGSKTFDAGTKAKLASPGANRYFSLRFTEAKTLVK